MCIHCLRLSITRRAYSQGHKYLTWTSPKKFWKLILFQCKCNPNCLLYKGTCYMWLWVLVCCINVDFFGIIRTSQRWSSVSLLYKGWRESTIISGTSLNVDRTYYSLISGINAICLELNHEPLYSRDEEDYGGKPWSKFTKKSVTIFLCDDGYSSGQKKVPVT